MSNEIIKREKVLRAVVLQQTANLQIETYGQCTDDVIDELIEITDSMTPEEQDAFVTGCLTK
jgi:transcription termination factor NusB